MQSHFIGSIGLYGLKVSQGLSSWVGSGSNGDRPMSPVAQKSNGDEIDRDLTLHLIDKMSANLVEAGKGVNRVMLLVLVAAVIVFALSAGWVSIDQKVSIWGTSLNISFPTVLISFCWLIVVAFANQVGLAIHEERLCDSILRLYRELGLWDRSLDDPYANPLEYPNFVTTIARIGDLKADWIKSLLRFLAGALSLVPPCGAIIFAHLRLLSHYGAQWWVITSFLGTSIAMVLSLLSAFN
jgi:hypothetical protein